MVNFFKNVKFFEVISNAIKYYYNLYMTISTKGGKE